MGVHGLLPKLPVLHRLHDPVAAFFNKLGFQVCFSGRTPMRAAWGAVRADEVRPGMELLSRSEFDPEGAVVPRLVEEVFVREGLIWLFTVMGQTVETTGEHPFFVKDKGWTALNRIAVGDWVWTETSGWVTVEGVEETGRWETVYNFRIAEHHTYFVGDDDWGFALWAHNANYNNFHDFWKAEKRRFGNIKEGRAAYRALRQFQSEHGLDNLSKARFADDTEALNTMLYLREEGHLWPTVADGIEGYKARQLVEQQLAQMGESLGEFPLIKPGSRGGPTAYQARFPDDVRAAALAENPSKICVFCRRVGPEINVDLDHAIAHSRGGNATIENAQWACSHCNSSKKAGRYPVNPPADYVGEWPPLHWPS